MLLKLTLYTRRSCFLCDKMKAAIRHVADDIPLSLEEIDIDTSPELTARYGRDIPVLLVEGRAEEDARRTDGRAPAPVMPGPEGGTVPAYLPVTMKWPRRFCCQQVSVLSVQAGCSSPLLTMATRLSAMPRLTR